MWDFLVLAACGLAPEGRAVLQIEAGLVIRDGHRQRMKTVVTGR